MGPEQMRVAYVLQNVGVCVCFEAERLEEAGRLFRRCVEVREAKFGAEDMRKTSLRNYLGFANKCRQPACIDLASTL